MAALGTLPNSRDIESVTASVIVFGSGLASGVSVVASASDVEEAAIPTEFKQQFLVFSSILLNNKIIAFASPPASEAKLVTSSGEPKGVSTGSEPSFPAAVLPNK